MGGRKRTQKYICTFNVTAFPSTCKKNQIVTIDGKLENIYIVKPIENGKPLKFEYGTHNGLYNLDLHNPQKHGHDILSLICSLDEQIIDLSYEQFFGQHGFWINTDSSCFTSFYEEDVLSCIHFISIICKILNIAHNPNLASDDYQKLLYYFIDLLKSNCVSFSFDEFTELDDGMRITPKAIKNEIIKPHPVSVIFDASVCYDALHWLVEEITISNYENKEIPMIYDSFTHKKREIDSAYLFSLYNNDDGLSIADNIGILYFSRYFKNNELAQQIVDFLYNLQNSYPSVDFYSNPFSDLELHLEQTYKIRLKEFCHELCVYYVKAGIQGVQLDTDHYAFGKIVLTIPDLLRASFIAIYLTDFQEDTLKNCAMSDCNRFFITSRKSGRMHCCDTHGARKRKRIERNKQSIES